MGVEDAVAEERLADGVLVEGLLLLEVEMKLQVGRLVVAEVCGDLQARPEALTGPLEVRAGLEGESGDDVATLAGKVFQVRRDLGKVRRGGSRRAR